MRISSQHIFIFSILIGVLFVVSIEDAHAYDLVNIPATICDFSRCRQATIFAIGTSLTPIIDLDNGFNVYVGRNISGYTESNPNTPLPSDLPDFVFGQELAEFVKLVDIESLTINNILFTQTAFAQLPNYQNIVFAALVTPPSGMTVVQGPYAAQIQGVEQMSITPLPAGATSDVKLADVDSDGRLDIVFTAGGYVYAMRQNGFLLPGFPTTFPGGSVFGVSVGDIDPTSPGLEIVTLGYDTQSSNRLVAFRSNGTVLFNFWNLGIAGGPISLAAGNNPIMLQDVDGDGVKDVIAVGSVAIQTPTGPMSRTLVQVVNGSGVSLPGYPDISTFLLGATPGSLAVGNVDTDPGMELVLIQTLQVGSTNQQIVVYDLSTPTIQNIFTSQMSGGVFVTSPLLFNADADPESEIAIVNQSLSGLTFISMEIFNAGGGYVPGFPALFSTFYNVTVSNLVAGDVDGDGMLEVGVGWSNAGGSSGFRFFNLDGTLATVTAVPIPPPAFTSVLRLGDTDSDTNLELVTYSFNNLSTVPSTSFSISENTSVGSPSSSVTIPLPFDFYRGPSLSDIDGDGVLEFVVIKAGLAGSAQMEVWKVAYYNGATYNGSTFLMENVNPQNTNSL